MKAVIPRDKSVSDEDFDNISHFSKFSRKRESDARRRHSQIVNVSDFKHLDTVDEDVSEHENVVAQPQKTLLEPLQEEDEEADAHEETGKNTVKIKVSNVD